MLDTLHYWHWWVIAVVLVILELTVSGAFFFLWIATAAALTGLVALIPGITWQWQLFVFALLAVVSVFLWKRYKPKDEPSDQPALNKRGHQYIGRHFTLDHPIVNGIGKLTVADTIWRIVGDDLPAGTKITVISVEGTSLRVAPAA